MKRGKDRQPRKMTQASIDNLVPLDRVLPHGLESVQVRVYVDPRTARSWRKLSPTERGEVVMRAEQAGYSRGALELVEPEEWGD